MTRRAKALLVAATLGAAILVTFPVGVRAQASTGFRLTEQVFNAGVRPMQAVVASSPSCIDRPPGEVIVRQFRADRQTLT